METYKRKDCSLFAKFAVLGKYAGVGVGVDVDVDVGAAAVGKQKVWADKPEGSRRR